MGHDKVNHIKVEPTCTEKGNEAYETCTRCDYTTFVEIAELGHDKVNHIKVDATCTEKGNEAYETCTRCDYTTFVEIEALGHVKALIPSKSATCTETGLTVGIKCSVCGETITAQQTIPAKGHTEKTVSGKEATCTEAGLTAGVNCSVCGETITAQQTISAKGHTEETVAGKEATCTEVGLTAGVNCSVCGETLTIQEEIPALGHNTVNHAKVEPTCTENGNKAYETCTRCDYTTFEEISATGHGASDTCSSDENHHWYICEFCGISLAKEEHTPDREEPTEEHSVKCTECGYVMAALEQYKDSNGLLYTLVGDKMVVTGIDRTINDSIIKGIKIPSTVNGFEVVAIESNAFKSFGEEFSNTKYANMASSYVTFYIPTTIKRIGDNAFAKCLGIKVSLYDPSSQVADYASWDKTVTWGSGNTHARDCIWGFRPAIGWTRYSHANIPDDYE